MNKPQHVIVPLGANCSAAHYLRRQNIREAAYPFDWTVTPLTSIIDLIENSFSDYLNSDNLTYLPPSKRYKFNEQGTQLETTEELVTPVVCKKHKILFPHDFSELASRDLPHIQKAYQRRINRFIQLLSSDKKITFIINHGTNTVNEWQHEQYQLAGTAFPQSSSTDVKRLFKALSKQYEISRFSVTKLSSFKRKRSLYKTYHQIINTIKGQ